MKKVLILFTLVLSLFALTACTGTEVEDLEADLAAAQAALAVAEGDVSDLEADLVAAQAALAAATLPDLPAVVDMSNIDMYLGRPDAQYVDLRNFDDKMSAGYIAGFEMIPFFDYLEHEAVLSRTNVWTFEAAGIGNQAQLENLFDKDAEAIFLMCGSGTRAGFVLDALESIGYTNVINIGGTNTYTGDNKVLGLAGFELNHPAAGMYTPGTYFAVDPQTQYTTTIVVGEGGAIVDVVFDAMYHGTTKNTLDTAYMLASGFTWKEEAAELAAYVLANQGWGEILLDVTDLTGLNALTVPHHFIDIDHTGTVDAVAGVTIGAEGFVLSWNLAIAQAGGTPLAGVPTSQEWADAHAPAFNYMDGLYFGMDEAHGYNAQVLIEDGFIVSVFFDALQAETAIVVNDNDTPADLTDDFDEAVVTSWSTKQVLGFDYGMVAYGGAAYEWFQHANMLADAILDAQQWDPAWVITPGTAGGHDKFDNVDVAEELCTADDVTNGVLDALGVACVLDAVKVVAYDADDATVDAVGGVTIGIEGFEMAFNEAIAQAIPGVLFISEYIEGSGNNKALEIYNPTDMEVDLTGYVIVEHYNETGSNSYELTGTLAAGEVLVLCTDAIDAGTLLETNCDVQFGYPSVVHFNGDDVIQLYKFDVLLDQIGVEADAGGDDYAANVTLVRNPNIVMGNPVYDAAEWTEYAQDTFDYIGSHVVD